MITSVHNDQKSLIKSIRTLYKIERFDLDATFNTGTIHYGVNPKIMSDLNPITENVLKADCRNLDFIRSGSLCSILFDPPFLAGGGATGKMHNKYSSFKNVEEMLLMYSDSIKESFRILKTGGIFVFKCQDLCNGRVQTFSHCEIYNIAIEAGFYAKDLFLLISNKRMKPYKMKTQIHSRKYHSYFWVFQKCRRKNKRMKKTIGDHQGGE